MTTDEFIINLEKNGWFDLYPEKLINHVKNEIAKVPPMPWVGLDLCGGDSECIYEEGDYTKNWINPFIESSFGLFSPTSISETWHEIGDQEWDINISFEINGEVFETEIEQIGDYTDPKIFELFNSAIMKANPSLRLIQIEEGAQDVHYTINNLEKYMKAYRSDLLPKWNWDPFNQEERERCFPLTLGWHLKEECSLESEISNNETEPPKKKSLLSKLFWK